MAGLKPVELVERAILNSSRRQAVVLDPFCGAGSTLIACEKTGRQARLIEIEPKYVDVTIERWQKFTGKQATLAGDGRTFAEIARTRGQQGTQLLISAELPLEGERNEKAA
jgi:DNA modification methylase